MKSLRLSFNGKSRWVSCEIPCRVTFIFCPFTLNRPRTTCSRDWDNSLWLRFDGSSQQVTLFDIRLQRNYYIINSSEFILYYYSFSRFIEILIHFVTLNAILCWIDDAACRRIDRGYNFRALILTLHLTVNTFNYYVVNEPRPLISNWRSSLNLQRNVPTRTDCEWDPTPWAPLRKTVSFIVLSLTTEARHHQTVLQCTAQTPSWLPLTGLSLTTSQCAASQ